MPKKIWRLTVRDEISAGHALRHYEGKCERLHGHNFAVELTVEGDKLTENVELLLDFKVLKRALKEELAALDHQIINEVPPFDRLNPSSENISRHIFQNVARRLAAIAGLLLRGRQGRPSSPAPLPSSRKLFR